MSDLCIPDSALQSPKEFHEWYLRMSARLFPVVQKVYVPDFEEKVILTDVEKTFERILYWANFIFNQEVPIVPYKTQDGRKATRKVTDVISISATIMMTHYNIIQDELASILGINRSTISYYIKRHNSSCMYKDYMQKYNELLICLRNEGLISGV
jgi:hypothetical protein